MLKMLSALVFRSIHLRITYSVGFRVKLRVELDIFKQSLQTAKQSGTLLDRRNVLGRSIDAVEELRGVYMPGLLQLLTDTKENTSRDPDSNPEDTKLWLPSNISALDRVWVCHEGLTDMEARLRKARCYDALDGLRHTLRVKSRMILFKNANVRGQRDSGRSREVIDGIHNRAKGFAEKYRRNREALLKLLGPGTWEDELRPLENADVRGYGNVSRAKVGSGRQGTNEEAPGNEGVIIVEEPIVTIDDELDLLPEIRSRRQGTGESREKLSWIWWTTPVSVKDGTDPDNELLRVEWCKSRARVARAREELRYVKEDMRRTMAFLGWKEQWWRSQRHRRSNVDPELQEGLKAYALKQEYIQRGLSNKFRTIWKQPLNSKDYEEDLDDHRLRMDLGLRSGLDEDEMEQDTEDVEGEEDMDMGDDAGADQGIDMDDEDLGWG